MGNEIIKIEHLRKDFGSRCVLKDINFTVKPKEVVCIIGSSGSGKSTLLRCINLLERPTSGEIFYHDKDITTGKMSLAKLRSKVGMVFQQFNLFNNLTVLENCVIGQMKVLKRTKKGGSQLEEFDLNKIVNAVKKAYASQKKEPDEEVLSGSDSIFSSANASDSSNGNPHNCANAIRERANPLSTLVCAISA